MKKIWGMRLKLSSAPLMVTLITMFVYFTAGFGSIKSASSDGQSQQEAVLWSTSPGTSKTRRKTIWLQDCCKLIIVVHIVSKVFKLKIWCQQYVHVVYIMLGSLFLVLRWMVSEMICTSSFVPFSALVLICFLYPFYACIYLLSFQFSNFIFNCSYDIVQSPSVYEV